MKKYWQFFKTNFEVFFEHREDLMISFLINLFVFVGFVFVWTHIENEGNTITGYGLSGIIFYYLCTQAFGSLFTSQTSRDLRNNIIKGYLSEKLIKPFNVRGYFFCKNLSKILSELMLYSVMTIPIFIVAPSLLNNIDFNIVTFIKFFIGCFLAVIFNFSLFFTVGISSFWSKESFGLQMVVKNAIRFFIGSIIPIDLLPINFQRIILLTPFPYMIYYPIKILMGDIVLEEFIKSYGIFIFWIIIFLILNKFLWKKGLKQYEAVGM